MSKNYYAEAISILQEDVNFRDVVYEIARIHPKALIEAAKGKTVTSTGVEKEICKIIKETGQFILAIKKHRGLTKSSLVESRAAVEAINLKMGNPLGLTIKP